MGTKVNSNYEDLLTFTRASKGHALRPVSYGDELVTNGDFSNGTTGWTASGSQSVVDGKLYWVRSSLGGVYQSVTTKAGSIYVVDFTLSGEVGSVRFSPRDGSVGGTQIGNVDIGDGTQRLIFVALSSTTVLYWQNTTAGEFYLDDVSVKEVLFDQPDGTLTLFEHPNNVPRVEYDADGNRLGLLVEESRTNLITHSENFSNSSWNSNKQGISVSRDVAVAPDGTLTADKLNETATTDTHRVGFNISSVGDAVFSFFAKAGERTFVRTWAFVGGNTAGAEFNLSTGAIVREHTSGAATIKNVGNGWYRCSCIVDAASANSVVVGPVTEAVSGNANYAGEAGKGIYIWGAQLEEASFPTSYMKTTGSTATRSADVASIPVADFGYNQSAGTVTVEVDSLMTTLVGNPMAYNLNNGTSQERLTVFASQGTWRFVATDGNTQQSSLLVGTFGEAKIASSFEQNKFNHCVNATLGTEDTSGTMPTITELGIGSQLGGNQLNGHIKSIKYYPRRLTNVQLLALTGAETLILTEDRDYLITESNETLIY